MNDDSLIGPASGRQGDGATFLVVADDSKEFGAALRYACKAARRNRGYLGILKIIEDQDFQNWGTVEALMKKELRTQGEQYLWDVAKIANDESSLIPSLYFAEGDASEAVMQTIEKDPNIAQLILGAGQEDGPGPIVTYLLNKGFSRLRIPVVIVPAGLKEIS